MFIREEPVNLVDLIFYVSEHGLIVPLIVILVCSVLITIKSRFVQFRAFRHMFSMLLGSISKSDCNEGRKTIAPHKALFVAMSTSIGIGNITGPVLAVGFGGPGALAGFVIGSIFGAASVFTEVYLAIIHRKKLPNGTIMGGPMQYLKDCFGNWLAATYAYFGCLLLVVFSSCQSNTLSTLLQSKGISQYATAFILSTVTFLILVGGIKRIGEFSEKLVPFMFILYSVATIWVIGIHYDQLIPVFKLVWNSLWTPLGAAGAGAGYGMQQAIRWGVAKGFQATESGLGTSTFPHSMTCEADPMQQSVLAMVAVYSNGFLCTLSALTILVTGAWREPGVIFDITMLSGVFESHFPMVGPHVLLLSSFLFAIGTIIGNSYNGSQCFLYITKNRWVNAYYVFATAAVFAGCLFGVKFIWTITDFFMLLVGVPNVIAVLILAYKNKNIFKLR